MIVIRIVLWLIILGAIASPFAAWYGLEDKPLVTSSAKVGVRDIQSAKDFLKQYDPRNLPDGRITTITANQGQINTALAAALAAVPMFKARIVPSRFGLLAAITGEAPIPDNPFGKYVNISMLVESSSDGLKIGRLSVGEIEIPTAIVRPVFILVMDQVAGPGRGKAFLETIRSVQITGSQVRVVYRPKEGLLDEIKTAAQTTVIAGNPVITRVYWEALHDKMRRTPSRGRASLAEFVQPIFDLARKRSAGGNAIEENKGAIFALAMFFGDIRIERFVGEVRQGEYKATKNIPCPRPGSA